MSNQKKNKKSIISIVILLLISILSVGITKFNLFSKLDFRLYDFMLGLTRETKENNDIVLVEIDNDSIGKIGSWPWSRDIIGNALVRMKEFGARQAVFDIEYVSPSVKAVDEKLEQKINDNFAKGQQIIQNAITDFGMGISDGLISADNAAAETENLAGITDNVLYEMQRDITDDFNKDNDDYFARCVQFFGNASLTVNMRNISIETEPEEIAYVENRFLFDNVSDPHGYIIQGNRNTEKEEGINVLTDFVPPIHKIVSRAKGVGFTNVVVDKDGTRRRVQILNEQNGKYAGQLSFAPLIKSMGYDSIERTRNSYIVHGLNLADGKKDIVIPVDQNGRMLINWLHSEYGEGFVHIPAYLLYNLDLAEKVIQENIQKICAASFDSLSEDDRAYILENCSYAAEEYDGILKQKIKMLLKCRGFDAEGKAIRGGLTDEDYQSYFERRKNFFNDLNEFAKSFTDIPGFADEKILGELKFSVEKYLENFNYLAGKFKNGFCIIGNTASSSTDLGVTPFEKSYPNLGTHANVANTIIQQDFIVEKSPLWGIAIGFAVAFIVLLATLGISYAKKNVISIIYVIIPIAILCSSMIFFKIYIPVVNAAIMVIVIYIAETILNFRLINNEKKFIQGAFSQCLSKDVVNDIIAHPEKFTLGGESREMTAIFTDIQKFSGFSELLNAAELVALLNHYLTKMSDIIIEEHGTVDKYEGDAIVALVGAPQVMNDHAIRACTAAIKMKKYEVELNKEITKYASGEGAENLDPVLLSAFKKMVENKRQIFTRIGINSGEMVAGFMGSENKKNYTMMGNNVNLASRLEGVNKQYSTGGILISEATRVQLGDNFVVRSLDRVQVVNVKTPMRLYEVMELKSEATPNLLKHVEVWEHAMKVFENGNYGEALKLFHKLEQHMENDNVAKYYISLIEKFFIKGKYPTKDDDFGVAYNAANPAEMDPAWIGTKYEIKGTFTLLQK